MALRSGKFEVVVRRVRASTANRCWQARTHMGENEMNPCMRKLTGFLVGSVLSLVVNGLAVADRLELVTVVLTAQTPAVANEKIAKRDAAGGRETPLSESAKAALSSSVSDRAAPVLVFRSPADALHWVKEMDRRLQSRIPDKTTRTQLLTTVHYEATRAGLDPQLVLALIDVQSGFRKYAVSSAGARGYMQVMPFWVKLIGEPHHNLLGLRTNLRYGCVILRYFLDLEKGDTFLALGHYNGGAGNSKLPNLVHGVWRGRWAYDGPKS